MTVTVDDVPRRIDATIERLSAAIAAASPEQRERLAQTPQWSIVAAVAALRSMERAEEQVLGNRGMSPIAEAYDRCAVPGEPAVDTLLRTFQTVFGRDLQRQSEGLRA